MENNAPAHFGCSSVFRTRVLTGLQSDDMADDAPAYFRRAGTAYTLELSLDCKRMMGLMVHLAAIRNPSTVSGSLAGSFHRSLSLAPLKDPFPA